MQRNLGSEVLIAVVGLGIIICGLLFALLLSNDSNTPEPTRTNIASIIISDTPEPPATDAPEPTETTEPTTTNTDVPTDTPEPTATNTDVPTDTPEPTATNTDVPTNTPEPTATNTDVPTDTPEPTATNTDVPTDTPEPTATNTDVPTDTPEPTATNTDVPTDTPEPTATNTDVPTNTPEPTATNTDVPTDTPEPTATNTDIPTDTPEPKPTNTDRPTITPSATYTAEPTETPEPKPTNTERPTRTPSATATVRPTNTEVTGFTGIIPTLPPSPTVAPLNEPTRTPATCELPSGWTTYTVLSGDTLFAISLVTNSTVDELRFANCIDDIDNITAGDRVYVPIEPVRPVSTLMPSGVRQGLTSIGCTSPTTQITNLVPSQSVSGTFDVVGTATRSDFQYYKIEVRPDFADIYNFYSDSQTQVINDRLGQINAELFGAGLHWIRLSVVDIRATIPSDGICEIPVIFE